MAISLTNSVFRISLTGREISSFSGISTDFTPQVVQSAEFTTGGAVNRQLFKSVTAATAGAVTIAGDSLSEIWNTAGTYNNGQVYALFIINRSFTNVVTIASPVGAACLFFPSNASDANKIMLRPGGFFGWGGDDAYTSATSFNFDSGSSLSITTVGTDATHAVEFWMNAV